MCLEKISTGSFVNMVAHPDGSARVFVSSQDGKIWLASVPAHDEAGGTLRIHRLFLNLTDREHNELRGVAFHPEFSTNGRFFVAYTCDSASPACWVPTAGKRSRPGRYQFVVAEYRATGGGARYLKVCSLHY